MILLCLVRSSSVGMFFRESASIWDMHRDYVPQSVILYACHTGLDSSAIWIPYSVLRLNLSGRTTHITDRWGRHRTRLQCTMSNEACSGPQRQATVLLLRISPGTCASSRSPDTLTLKYYTIPATQSTPYYPTPPASFPNVALSFGIRSTSSKRSAVGAEEDGDCNRRKKS